MKKFLLTVAVISFTYSSSFACGGTIYYVGDASGWINDAIDNCPVGTVTTLINFDHGGKVYAHGKGTNVQ